jgi:Sel1 repeat
VTATILLGYLYLVGHGVAKHQGQARLLFIKSLRAKVKSETAMCGLARIYLDSLPTKGKVYKAMAYLKLAASLGSGEALFNLAYINLYGVHIAQKRNRRFALAASLG